MKQADVEAIAGGYCRDPFAVLGPHEVEGAWEVRVFAPEAATVSVVLDGSPHPSEQIHKKGVFVTRMAGSVRRDYTLRVANASGEVSDFEDPYRFGPLIEPFDLHVHAEGSGYAAYRMLGAHLAKADGIEGVRFAVWAPGAEMVSVVGVFNGWDERRHPMRLRDGGIWEIFLAGLGVGTIYKYCVKRQGGAFTLKSDPYAFHSEVPPNTASIVWDTSRYQWNDQEWMDHRASRDLLKAPVSVYEVHLESWMRHPDGSHYSYRELAERLVDYVRAMGYTHIELMPITEFPFSGSWGYQVTGYFAPTSRFGNPDDFRYFVDCCHQAGIGVIVDWVPAHFPRDEHGLRRFDGSACYEHEDPRQGEHKDWGTHIFNFGRNEVRVFLISSALFWLQEYHIDGLRVDAVASMLYLDYSREPGEWIPNKYGGRENLEAVDFLRRFNELVHQVPGAITIAEESTSFPAVSRPVYLGGLGFTFKWNMGWMHDMFHYFKLDPVYRKYNHNDITFSLLYAFTENFMLPISHDEVVHLKSSLVGKMPGDEWQRFANVRAFLSYMWAHPGKKLLFMGTEIGQTTEWNYQAALPWELLQYPIHKGIQQLVQDLNAMYRSEPALYEVDYHWEGFEWVDFHDVEKSIISFFRYSEGRKSRLLWICNFTPVAYQGYRLGVPIGGVYNEFFNSDDRRYHGSGVQNPFPIRSQPGNYQGKPHDISLTIPPLAVIGLRVTSESEAPPDQVVKELMKPSDVEPGSLV